MVVVFVPQAVSVRKISVADSYCNAFYFVLFVLPSFVCTFVGLRVVSFFLFVSWFVFYVVISVMLALVWLLFVPGCRFRAFACAMCVAAICL